METGRHEYAQRQRASHSRGRLVIGERHRNKIVTIHIDAVSLNSSLCPPSLEAGRITAGRGLVTKFFPHVANNDYR